MMAGYVFTPGLKSASEDDGTRSGFPLALSLSISLYIYRSSLDSSGVRRSRVRCERRSRVVEWATRPRGSKNKRRRGAEPPIEMNKTDLIQKGHMNLLTRNTHAVRTLV